MPVPTRGTRLARRLAAAALFAFAAGRLAAAPSARQSAAGHLSSVVDKLARGERVFGVYVGPSDLSNSLGLPRNDPEVEEGIQTVVDTCRAQGVTCGITASAADMPRRIEQGFTMLGAGRAGGGLPASVDAAVRAGRAAID